LESYLCDIEMVAIKCRIVRKYVSKIDWSNPCNDFPIPERIKNALK
jgi:hypothetical protein